MGFTETLSALLSPFMQGLLVATGIGIILGLEREFNTQSEESHLAGIRTFPLVAILGYTVAVSAKTLSPLLLIAGFIGFFALVCIAYYVQTQNGKLGLSTTLALLLTFSLGALVSTGAMANSLAVAVITATVLSVKEQVHRFIRQITVEELYAFIKFFVLALLLLPLLPDTPFGPENLMNYRDIGWIVVIVSSISFSGYLMLKFYGLHRGILLMAAIGGLYSSTMVAWIFSARSRETNTASATYAAGAILSSSIMFLRVLFLCFIFNPLLAGRLFIPCFILAIMSGLFAWRTARSERHKGPASDFPMGNPLDFKNALFFMALYLAVTYFTFFARQWFGAAGAYSSGAISGVADMDAITISTGKWALGFPRVLDGANIILIAMLSNSVFKGAICVVRGTAEMRRWSAGGFGIILATGLAILAFQMILLQ